MRIVYLFMLVMLDFVSDWYSIHKIQRGPSQLKQTFNLMNKLRGHLRDKIEHGEKDEIA